MRLTAASIFSRVPQRAQRHVGFAEGDRVRAKLDAHGPGVGRQRDFQRQRAVEPGEKFGRLFRIEDRFLDRDQRALVERHHHPFAPVRGDADEGLAGLRLAIGEIVGHLALDVLHLAREVALGLEHRAADQRVDAALDLDALLEADFGEGYVEFVDQQLAEIGLDLIMTGLAGEVA